MLVASTAVAKVHDGSAFAFYHYVRLFLAVPLAATLCLAAAESSLIRSPPGQRAASFERARLVAAIVLLTLAAGREAAKIATFAEWKRRLWQVPVFGVGFARVDELRQRCDEVATRARTRGVRLVVFADYDRIFAYACRGLEPERIETLLAGYERRTWLVERWSRDSAPFILATCPRDSPDGCLVPIDARPVSDVLRARGMRIR